MTDIINSPGSVNQFFSPSLSGVISTPLSIWVSAATGNDANAGTSAAAPLATFAAFVSRYGVSPIVNASLIITFLDATVTEDIFFSPIVGSSGTVVLAGTQTTVASGSLTAVPTQRNATTNTSLEITDSTKTWATYVGINMIVMTSGSGTGAVAWPIKDTGSNKVRLTPLVQCGVAVGPFPTEVATVANGNTYNLVSFTKFSGAFNIQAQGNETWSSVSAMWVINADFSSATNQPALFTSSSKYGCAANVRYSGAFTYATGSGSFISNALVTAASLGPVDSNGQTYYLLGGGAINNLTFRTPVTLLTGFTVQGGEIDSYAQCAQVFIGDAMVQDWPVQALRFDNGGLFSISKLSGTSTALGSYVIRGESGVAQHLGASWAVSVYARGQATASYDFKIGLPLQTQGSPYVPGSGIQAAEVTYTFAHLDAAAGVSGFGGSTSRLNGSAALV
jgi:hypothetical protein